MIVAKVGAASESTHATPRVLGVDDWAVRRSQTSGTILLDLERHAVIDVLADREASTFATWLRAHPGVEIVSRDRGGAYAEAAREAAPDAIQIADRFFTSCAISPTHSARPVRDIIGSYALSNSNSRDRQVLDRSGGAGATRDCRTTVMNRRATSGASRRIGRVDSHASSRWCSCMPRD